MIVLTFWLVTINQFHGSRIAELYAEHNTFFVNFLSFLVLFPQKNSPNLLKKVNSGWIPYIFLSLLWFYQFTFWFFLLFFYQLRSYTLGTNSFETDEIMLSNKMVDSFS